jgi:hypothetical protein
VSEYGLDLRTLATAHNAAKRAQALATGLDQSRRSTDVDQAVAGLIHELRTIVPAIEAAFVGLHEVQQAAAADTPGKVRTDAPATSRAAARTIRTGTARYRVLTMIAYAGPVTDHQLQRGLQMNASTERPRRGELVDLGLVSPAGVAMHDGREWTTWSVTLLGRSVVRRLAGGDKSVVVPETLTAAESTPDEPDGEPVLF